LMGRVGTTPEPGTFFMLATGLLVLLSGKFWITLPRRHLLSTPKSPH
jgi:hypothetical protein